MRGIAGLVLVSALLAACTESDEPTARAPRPTSTYVATEPVPGALPDGCPPRDAPLRFADGGVLPEGAEWVRLCNGAPEGLDVPFDAPLDLLETGVDQVVEAANALPFPEVSVGRTFCTADAGPTLVYWFGYPDGDARAVMSNRGGCRQVVVGPNDHRTDFESLAAAFEQALTEQRAGRLPPPLPTPAKEACRRPDFTVTQLQVAEPLRLGSATVCHLRDDGSWRRAELTEGRLRAVAGGLERSEQRYVECKGPYLSLLGETVWGDRIQLTGTCGRLDQLMTSASHRRGDPPVQWVADRALVALLVDAARQ